jgi:hypothetical protein
VSIERISLSVGDSEGRVLSLVLRLDELGERSASALLDHEPELADVVKLQRRREAQVSADDEAVLH